MCGEAGGGGNGGAQVRTFLALGEVVRGAAAAEGGGGGVKTLKNMP